MLSFHLDDNYVAHIGACKNIDIRSPCLLLSFELYKIHFSMSTLSLSLPPFYSNKLTLTVSNLSMKLNQEWDFTWFEPMPLLLQWGKKKTTRRVNFLSTW